jgi:CDP-6-deoxy-D-xylo-4-hexulose-3-dehydrase
MTRIPLASETIDGGDIEALVAWLRSGPRLTKAALTVEFEERWAAWVGRRYAVFVNSGSSADLLMVAALEVSGRLRNKTAVLPATSWATTVAPAIQLGFTPVLCDSLPGTWALDPAMLEDLVKRHNPGLVTLVHVLGVPAEIGPILELRDRYGFELIEDACAALGSTLAGRHCGTFGVMGSYSLYFGHQMSTIEGGMVVTDDPELHDLLLLLRSHGWSKDLAPERRAGRDAAAGFDPFHEPFVFHEPGFNLRSTDLNAFLGLRQIERAECVAEARAANDARYRARLAGAVGCQSPPARSRAATIHVAAVASDAAARRRIVEALDAAGIETRLFTAASIGRHPFWTRRYGAAPLPHADHLFEGGFFLPNHLALTEKDIDEICDIVIGSCQPGK